LVEAFVRGEAIAELSVEVPPISVELSGHPPYKPLMNLQPVQLEHDGHLLSFTAISSSGCFGIRLVLDFAKERIHFDIDSNLHAQDDGTSEGALAIAEIGRFTRDYWGNGKLRILNADTGALLSRKDAFIPVNCWLDVAAADARIEEWKAIARGRADAGSTP
jgi:hypothetical protein